MKGGIMENIKCSCGKLLAKRHDDGKIYVWCKECKKEIILEVEPYEPNNKHKKICRDASQ